MFSGSDNALIAFLKMHGRLLSALFLVPILKRFVLGKPVHAVSATSERRILNIDVCQYMQSEC